MVSAKLQGIWADMFGLPSQPQEKGLMHFRNGYPGQMTCIRQTKLPTNIPLDMLHLLQDGLPVRVGPDGLWQGHRDPILSLKSAASQLSAWNGSPKCTGL